MISGKEFFNQANWNLCSRYPVNFNLSEIKENDFIFVNLDNFYHFLDLINGKSIPKFNLITHNSDLSFDQKMLNYIQKYTNRIFAINCIIEGDKITKIPLGFSDRLSPLIQSIQVDVDNKQNLVYMNFKIYQNHALERKECFKQFQDSDWVLSEDNVDESLFYKNLSLSKFSLCPVGIGLDTHRFYESIYFNTIPIVKRNLISDLHSKFPCIIVDNWSEITEQFLEQNWNKYYNDLLNWKKNNDWLHPEFWLK